MNKWIIGFAVTTLFLTTFVTTGFTEEPQGLQFRIAPYIWYNGINGDVTINGNKIDFEKDASDLIKAVDWGVSAQGLVQYKRFLFWGAFDYFSLSTDELDAEDRPQHGKLDTDELLYEVAVGYLVDGFFEGQTFELLAGVRVLNIDNDLTIYATGNTISKDIDLTDPIFVVRPYIPVFPSKIKNLALIPTFAIGGGGDSDLVWELFPEIQYQFTETIAGRLGYRTVGYEFDGSGDNELDLNFEGLVAGMSFTF